MFMFLHRQSDTRNIELPETIEPAELNVRALPSLVVGRAELIVAAPPDVVTLPAVKELLDPSLPPRKR